LGDFVRSLCWRLYRKGFVRGGSSRGIKRAGEANQPGTAIAHRRAESQMDDALAYGHNASSIYAGTTGRKTHMEQ